VSDASEVSLDALVPDGPPELDDIGWRTLLGVLVDAAEATLGPEWRSRLTESPA